MSRKTYSPGWLAPLWCSLFRTVDLKVAMPQLRQPVSGDILMVTFFHNWCLLAASSVQHWQCPSWAWTSSNGSRLWHIGISASRNAGTLWYDLLVVALTTVESTAKTVPVMWLFSDTVYQFGENFSIVVPLVKVAWCPWWTKHVMEKRCLLSPGTYITSCSLMSNWLPLSSNMLLLILPVAGHFMMCPSATSTLRLLPLMTSSRSAYRVVMCWVAPELIR